MSELLRRVRERPAAVGVWLVRLTEHPLTDAVTDDLLSRLDDDTRHRVLRYRQPERDRTLVGHAALRGLLAPELGVEPATITLNRTCANCGSTDHGKPSLATTEGVEFSLSHSGDLVAVAIAGVPVGVDVERRSGGTDWASIRSETFDDDEWSDDPTVLADLWARKEAVVKATGVGMSGALSRIRPVGAGDRWHAGPVTGWDLLEGAPTHSAAVAIVGSEATSTPTVVELELGVDFGRVTGGARRA